MRSDTPKPARTALVVVPTFNERENLPVLVTALMAYPEVSVLVVDDASPDGTGALADELARKYAGRIDVMHRTERPGLGRSYVDGIRSVLDRPVDVICQMDCDLSHDPRHLRDLIAASERADVVIGSRYIPGGAVVNWPWRRRVLSRFANSYIRLVTRLSARDCTSGYRCWCRSIRPAPRDIPFSSRCCSRLPPRDSRSPKCRSRSSNGGWANRSCRTPSSSNRPSRHGA
jgi:dolichol-phosphate mannosyltransferase